MLPLSLLRAAAGSGILVELKNGDTYNGVLVNTDAWMNINLVGCGVAAACVVLSCAGAAWLRSRPGQCSAGQRWAGLGGADLVMHCTALHCSALE